MTRVRGLDALRFLCVLCVVQGHLRLGGYLILDRLKGPHDLVHYVRVAFNQGMPIPTGPNAVIVFFVVSGFCIHFPYRNRRRLEVKQFLLRRYIRIGLPALLAAVLLYNTGFKSLQDSVLWSIICELIYYSLYPLLMRLRDRLGWPKLLILSFVLTYTVVSLDSTGPFVGLNGSGQYNGDFISFGAQYTWILGLPCWLLGCLLAENYSRFPRYSWPVQWLLRFGVIAAASIGTTLRFYANVGYYWSQPLLGIVVFFWLGTEIAYFTTRPPWRWLEWCGGWSYSVYLYHAPVSIYVANHIVRQLDIRPRLLVEVAALLVVSFTLYCAVERPSHLLARRLMATAKPADVAGTRPVAAAE